MRGFFACSQKYPILQQEARLFLMVGILGGFTTFPVSVWKAFAIQARGYGPSGIICIIQLNHRHYGSGAGLLFNVMDAIAQLKRT